MSGKNNSNENKQIAHLSMIQGVITRMGYNSFTLKALAATFGSATVAAIAAMDDPSLYLPIAAVVPVFAFWIMDAQYLRLERAYRKLYDQVRKENVEDPFSLDASPYLKETSSVLRLAFSWSTSWFYFAVFLSLGLVTLLIYCGA